MLIHLTRHSHIGAGCDTQWTDDVRFFRLFGSFFSFRLRESRQFHSFCLLLLFLPLVGGFYRRKISFQISRWEEDTIRDPVEVLRRERENLSLQMDEKALPKLQGKQNDESTKGRRKERVLLQDSEHVADKLESVVNGRSPSGSPTMDAQIGVRGGVVGGE